MKNLISCELMPEDQALTLRLKDQPYIIAISKKLLAKYGIKETHLEFELTVDKDKKLVLTGPHIAKSVNPNKSTLGEEIDDSR